MKFTRRGVRPLIRALWLGFFLFPLPASLFSQSQSPQSVVLISLDGFRPDYIDSFPVANLRALAARGVRARWMVPSIPTLTFPNHYTIVTGLYPAHHGIINNSFWDPRDGAHFYYKDAASARESRWWGGEPIWVTAEKQGIHAATYFWPGSEAEIHGAHASEYRRYDERVPGAARVDTALMWLARRDSTRPRLVTLYFSMVDRHGHDDGPWAAATRAAVLGADSLVGRLVAGIERAGLSRSVNIIVVSDHGMAATPREHVVVLNPYFPPESLAVVEMSPFFSVTPKNGDVPASLARLRRVPHLAVFRRDSTPARWHYSENPRIPPIVGVMDEGWQLTVAGRTPPKPGDHGFDNNTPSMRATFLAAGPAFRQGMVAEPFQNIHVYDLLCRLLGLAPAPNDGSPDSTRAMLRN